MRPGEIMVLARAGMRNQQQDRVASPDEGVEAVDVSGAEGGRLADDGRAVIVGHGLVAQAGGIAARPPTRPSSRSAARDQAGRDVLGGAGPGPGAVEVVEQLDHVTVAGPAILGVDRSARVYWPRGSTVPPVSQPDRSG